MDAHTVAATTAFLGIGQEAWAIVGATLFGPIAAVLITRWRDRLADVHNRRLKIFRTLMATRKLTINTDHVAALNMVEVEFYGVTVIEEAWRNYIKHLNTCPHGVQPSDSDQRRWDDARLNLLAKLIFAISGFLDYKISELDIRNGGYAPDGWLYRDMRLSLMQEYVMGLASGKATVPVEVRQAGQSAAQQLPSPSSK